MTEQLDAADGGTPPGIAAVDTGGGVSGTGGGSGGIASNFGGPPELASALPALAPGAEPGAVAGGVPTLAFAAATLGAALEGPCVRRCESAELPAWFSQSTHLHFSPQCTSASKHSQYFLRQRDFLQRQPVLCFFAFEILAWNADGFLSSAALTASSRSPGYAVEF